MFLRAEVRVKVSDLVWVARGGKRKRMLPRMRFAGCSFRLRGTGVGRRGVLWIWLPQCPIRGGYSSG